MLLIAVLTTSFLAIKAKSERWLNKSQELALFALVFGIFAQMIGLFGAFQAIEQVGEVSQALLASGLKISSYPSIYGLLIFLIGKSVKITFNFIQKQEVR